MLTMPLRTHLSPGSQGGLPSPCIKDPHLFPSVPPFLHLQDSYREVYRKVSYVLPRAAPCLLCVSGSPPLTGGQRREKPWDVTALPWSRAEQG